MVTYTEAPISDKIDVRRRQLGISDAALSDTTGIPRSTLRTKIKNGDLFTVAELRRISAALGVATTYWLDDAKQAA